MGWVKYSYAELEGRISVGMKVRRAPGANSRHDHDGEEGITSIDASGFSIEGCHHSYAKGGYLELLETQDLQRATYRLKRSTPTMYAGAILQERCDDGTQPYDLLDHSFLKGNEAAAHTKFGISDRSLVEHAPTWFERVYPANPAWMNQAEVDAYKAFQASQKQKTKKTTKKVAPKKK